MAATNRPSFSLSCRASAVLPLRWRRRPPPAAARTRSSAAAASASAAAARSLRLVEGGAGGARRRTTDPPAAGAEAVAVGGDDEGVGVGEGDVDGGLPATVDEDGVADEDVEQLVDPGRSAAHVVAEQLTGRRAPAGCPTGGRAPRASDGAGHLAGVQVGQGLARPAAADVDDHGGEGLAGGGLERRLPPGVDLDEVEQRAQHAVDAGEVLGAGPGPGGVEGEGQGLGPGPPRVALGVGGAQGVLGRRPAAARPRPGSASAAATCVGQRSLGGLGLGDLGPEPLGLLAEPGQLGLEGLDPALDPLALGRRALDGAAQRRQLAPDLGRGARGWRRDAAGVELGRPVGRRTVPAPPPARPPRRRQALGVGGEAGGVGLDVGQLGGEPGRLGLERGDDGGVDGGAPLPIDRAAALGEHGGRGPRARSTTRSVRTRRSDTSSAAHGRTARPRWRARRRRAGRAWP